MPAGWSIEAKVFGEEIVNRRLLRFAAISLDASDAFREVIGILRDATEQNFATRGRSGGSTWKNLSPAYAKRTGRRVNERILQLTGRLYDSLTNETSPEHVEEVGPTQMRWGSRVPYGVYHQSSAPRTKIPYRPPVRLSQRRRQEIVKSLQRAIVEGSR